MTDEEWEEYKQSVESPIPLPAFDGIERCVWCKGFNAYFMHHIRMNQFGYAVVLCPSCERYTRVLVSLDLKFPRVEVSFTHRPIKPE